VNVAKPDGSIRDFTSEPSRGKKWYASSVKSVLESRMASEVA
jgi:hypothetical protein